MYPFSHAIEQHADNAQHAFSSDRGTTLHLALPALEALHKAWTTRLTRTKYQEFSSALEAGLSKVEEYYERTRDLDAYTFVMRSVILSLPINSPDLHFSA